MKLFETFSEYLQGINEAFFNKEQYLGKLDWRVNHNKKQLDVNPFNEDTEVFLDDCIKDIKNILKKESKEDYTIFTDYINDDEIETLFKLFEYAFQYEFLKKDDIPLLDTSIIEALKLLENFKKVVNKIPFLTEEGHESVAKIHSMRHAIHINQKALFNTGSSDYKTFNNFLEDDIHELMESVKPEVKYNDVFDSNHAIDLDDYTDDDGDFSYELQEKAYLEFEKMMDKVNENIRDWIERVNEKFGTKY